MSLWSLSSNTTWHQKWDTNKLKTELEEFSWMPDKGKNMNNNVSPPESFPFNQPGQWQRWMKRFSRYRTVSGLEEKPEKVQVDIFINCMGGKAEAILATFKLSHEDSENFELVKEKFEKHFKADTNICERDKFNRRCQVEGEFIDSFVTDHHVLAKSCDLKELEYKIHTGENCSGMP